MSSSNTQNMLAIAETYGLHEFSSEQIPLTIAEYDGIFNIETAINGCSFGMLSSNIFTQNVLSWIMIVINKCNDTCVRRSIYPEDVDVRNLFASLEYPVCSPDYVSIPVIKMSDNEWSIYPSLENSDSHITLQHLRTYTYTAPNSVCYLFHHVVIDGTSFVFVERQTLCAGACISDFVFWHFRAIA